MPHKRNPVRAAVVVAAALRVPGLVATMLSAMLQEHERGLGGWQAEWDTIPDLVITAGRAARALADSLDALVVDLTRMRANLDMTGGLTLAEAVAMRLAEKIGKQEAHATLERAAVRAGEERRAFADVLAEDPDVTRILSRSEIDEALSPDAYLGSAETFVANVLTRRREVVTMPFVDHGGCRCDTKSTETRGGPALLFSNSLGTDRQLWEPQLEALSPYFRIIRYDTRGHGSSDAPQGPYTIETLGLDAIAVLDAVGCRSRARLRIVARRLHRDVARRSHSRGASIGRAREYRPHASAPRRCGTSGSHRCRHPAWTHWQTRRWVDGSRTNSGRLARMWWRSTVACCRRRQPSAMPRPVPPFATPICGPRSEPSVCPTLIIAGHHDPVTPPADADDMRARIPAARVALLDGAHIINAEQAAAFNAQLSAFFTEQGAWHG